MLDYLTRMFSRTSAASVPATAPASIPRSAAEECKNRGNAHLANGELDAAADCYLQAIAIDPAYAEAHNNFGVVLLKQGDRERAMASFRYAVRIEPGLAKAHLNYGNALLEEGLPDDAVIAFRTALSVDPDLVEGHNNLGDLYRMQNKLDAALRCFEAALRVAPDYSKAHFGHALALLSSGQLQEGWRKYGHRFGIWDAPRPRPTFAPEWSGEPLDGKTILLWGDQGVGDQILFASLVREFMARAGHCIIECAPKLVPLFTFSFPGALVVPQTEPPHPDSRRPGIDFQIAIADAARWLRPSLDSFPRHRSYLAVEPVRIAHWRARLEALGPGIKVGFCWRSTLIEGQRSLHYTNLEQWGPIFAVPSAHFVSLQVGECAHELAMARQHFGVPLHAFPEVDLYDDLSESAALTLALDLVISAPTATSFLAAGLGIPTWMTSYTAPWQMLGTDHMPWFPAMRCFPRRWDQPWSEIIATLAAALKNEVSCRQER